MKNSLIRVFISLFLCCCLVLNVVSIPAKAVGVDWILRQIATDIGVSAILEGLGIFRDAASDYFGELVNEVTDALDTAGYVTSGMLNAYYQVDPLGTGSPLFAIPATLINFVRNWVFDENIAVATNNYNSTYYTGACSSFSEALAYASNCPRAFTGYKGGVRYVIICGNSSYVNLSNGQLSIPGYAVNHSVWCSDYTNWQTRTSSSVTYTYTDVVELTTSPIVKTDKALQLGFIAPSTTLFSAAYPQWLEHQRELEDGTTETVVQIGLGNTQAETETLTQEQIWSGQGTLTVPEVVPGSATLTDVISAIVALPGQMVVSITDALSTFFTPSGTIEAYSLDLKDLFPFCIPFDIYDFLAALSADPVPPVFEFDLNLGVATEPMKIDLSNWSDLAAIIRTLELGLFCVGLALKTRELIGG